MIERPMIPIGLTGYECAILNRLPGVLRALATHHEDLLSHLPLPDPSGVRSQHAIRAQILRREADRIDAGYGFTEQRTAEPASAVVENRSDFAD
jgi:hypothetical protein